MVDKEMIGIWRNTLKFSISSWLLKTNYEGMGKQDKEDFERDFDEILDLALIGLKCKTQLSQEGTTPSTADAISRQAAIDTLRMDIDIIPFTRAREYVREAIDTIGTRLEELPSVQPTLRERALTLLLNWAEECGFGYDNLPEEYERYKDEIEDMSYIDGMIYIAEKEVERNERPD